MPSVFLNFFFTFYVMLTCVKHTSIAFMNLIDSNLIYCIPQYTCSQYLYFTVSAIFTSFTYVCICITVLLPFVFTDMYPISFFAEFVNIYSG